MLLLLEHDDLLLERPCNRCKGSGVVRPPAHRGRDETCPACHGLGTQLTMLGRNIIRLVERHRAQPNHRAR